jgi:hypothetical protein
MEKEDTASLRWKKNAARLPDYIKTAGSMRQSRVNYGSRGLEHGS